MKLIDTRKTMRRVSLLYRLVLSFMRYSFVGWLKSPKHLHVSQLHLVPTTLALFAFYTRETR